MLLWRLQLWVLLSFFFFLFFFFQLDNLDIRGKNFLIANGTSKRRVEAELAQRDKEGLNLTKIISSLYPSYPPELHASHRNNSTHWCRKWPSLVIFSGGFVLIMLGLGINMSSPIRVLDMVPVQKDPSIQFKIHLLTEI